MSIFLYMTAMVTVVSIHSVKSGQVTQMPAELTGPFISWNIVYLYACVYLKCIFFKVENEFSHNAMEAPNARQSL